ncbi:hypothetical protein [Alishewanella longhuensis]
MKCWNTTIDIVLVPDTVLTDYQKAIIAEDYNMIDGERYLFQFVPR